VAGPVQAYQRHGNGLIIWNGLDMDDVEFNASLAKIWELDLLQSFDPALGLACAATVGRLVLAPVTNVELPPGTPVTFTATATDSGGAQIGGLPVTFTIRGVNSTACNALTDASGVASCSYAGTYLGTDIITATATIASQAVTSNFATQMWGPIKLEPLDATNPAFTMHTVTATVVDLSQATNPPPPRANVDVTFDVAGANEGNGTIATTDAQGHATFTYTGDFSGLDTIRATVTICDSTETCVDYPSNPVTKHWLPSECQTKPEGSTCEAPEITGQTPGTTKCEEGVCQGSRCEISDACARARDNTTAEQAGKGTIRLTCGSGTGVASKGDVCESKGFASTGGSVIALVQPGTEQAGGTAVTRGVRRKIGRKTGRAVVRLKLSKVGRRLLKQAGARQQPLVVAVETRVTIGGQASLLRSLVSMLARRR
jgi:hypothetical protein